MVAAFVVLGGFIWWSTRPSGPPRGFVSRTTMGDAWPLTVESGTLRCFDNTMVVLEASDGMTYAVNGTAMGAKKAGGDPRWPSIKQVSVPRSDAPGLIKDLTPLLDQGLALCR